MKNKMEFREYKFEIRKLNEADGSFEGYASLFNTLIPSYNEKVKPGAFTKTLKDNVTKDGKHGVVPIFKGHWSDDWIGLGDDAWEDKKGLYVQGTIDTNPGNHAASGTLSIMRMAQERGKPAGLSIGFRAMRESFETVKDNKIRILEEIDLMEYSITPFPAALKAGVVNVRSIVSDIGRLNRTERTLLMSELATYDTSDSDSEAVIDDEPDILHSINDALETAINTIRIGSIS